MGTAQKTGAPDFQRPDPALGNACPKSWSVSADTALEALGVDRTRGLSPAEVLRRRKHYGANRLRETKPRKGWQILWDQLASPIVVLLSGAALVALAFEEHLEAAAIGAVLVINSTIGFWTEWRALRAMNALRELGCVHTMVRREAATCLVPAEEIVPGDLVLLDAGDVLTADLRLVLASRLQVDESTLTGESLAVDKTIEPTAFDAALPDRSSMLFKGTAVMRGTGEGVVVATGMRTELGQISQLVEEAEAEITPLEARLDRLGRRLLFLTLAIAGLVAMTNIWAGRDLYVSIEIALALAVAAVPEGLPIVATLALARGMARMARRNALVENLSAVETLGSTSVLLVDKTGTLTENRMVVGELALPNETTILFDPHREPDGAFVVDGSNVNAENNPLLFEALRMAALCNNTVLADNGESSGLGDPTEVALLIAAQTAGLARGTLLDATPEIAEIAFDSDLKKMATLHRDGESVLAAVKGAPETVIPDCTELAAADGSSRVLDAAEQREWLERAEAMASRGQRVLALAKKTLADPSEFSYAAMTLVGLVGLLDPPRAGVRSAIAACQAAGIRVVMVTGDHLGTASHIAAATGLIEQIEGDPVSFLDARSLPEFDSLSEADVEEILRATVIARATPRQKLDIISLYQRRGSVIAMTGDGVNDAPALKKADIGIAMGKRGTQVAREAADMVLQDDELGTIVSAVAQGRAIFTNIRKFVLYLLSCNLSEILAVSAASLAQTPLPLLPLQILFLNLVTDVFPALALGVGEGAPSLMSERPRDSKEPLIARRHWIAIFGFGSAIALAVLGALILAIQIQGKSSAQATTISFLTLALAQLWHVFSMRETGSGWWSNEVTRNGWIWAALVLCLALIGLAVHWPPLAEILSVSDPGADGWALALTMSLLPLVLGQVVLAVRRRRAVISSQVVP